MAIKRQKYGNKRQKTRWGVFDSKLELKHYNELILLQRRGSIKNLKRQVPLKLAKSPKCKIIYKADFVFFDCEKKEWVIMDSKGFLTDSFRIKKAWLLDNFINFRFEVAFKDKKIIERPFNAYGVDFVKFMENFLKTIDN